MTSELSTANSFQVSCSCLLFRQEGNYAHRKSAKESESNWMRALSFSFRGVEALSVPEDALKWSTLSLSRNEKYDVQIWQVFRRKFLSSAYPTSGTVLFDFRFSRIEKRFLERVPYGILLGYCHRR